MDAELWVALIALAGTLIFNFLQAYRAKRDLHLQRKSIRQTYRPTANFRLDLPGDKGASDKRPTFHIMYEDESRYKIEFIYDVFNVGEGILVPELLNWTIRQEAFTHFPRDMWISSFDPEANITIFTENVFKPPLRPNESRRHVFTGSFPNNWSKLYIEILFVYSDMDNNWYATTKRIELNSIQVRSRDQNHHELKYTAGFDIERYADYVDQDFPLPKKTMKKLKRRYRYPGYPKGTLMTKLISRKPRE